MTAECIQHVILHSNSQQEHCVYSILYVQLIQCNYLQTVMTTQYDNRQHRGTFYKSATPNVQ